MLEGIADNGTQVNCWHVVRTAPRSEHLAAQELASNGFKPFCPLIIMGSINKNAYAPLFPGYIFAHKISESVGAQPIYMLPHVYGWVSIDGTVATVPEEVIKKLASRVESINSDGGLWHKFEIGELVNVTLFGVDTIGTVITSPKTPKKPIDILLDFMGTQVHAQVSVDKVNPFQYDLHTLKNTPRRSRGKGRLTRQYRDFRSLIPVSA